MSYQQASSNILLNMLSSSKLALVLVILLMIFALAGTVLPQQGALEPEQITQWQQTHPIVSSLLEPVGFFHVFHSWPFLIIIFLLGINTLTCTVLRFLKEGGFSGLKGPKAIERAGSYLLHLSLILLFAGGFCSAGMKLDGRIVLTEGQSFKEQHNGYLQLVEGPLHPENHKEFVVILKNVQIEYERKNYPIDITSNLEFFQQNNKLKEAVIKVNEPFTFRTLTFTQDETGFSPRLVIRDKDSKKVLVDSFIALKTFRTGQAAEYRDFLPLPFLENRVIITLYPSFVMDNGNIKQIGLEPENPLLLIETEDESGQVISKSHLPKGEKIVIGKYSFEFTDLRRWSSFRVTNDPGYSIVCFSLLLGTGTLILRYAPDLCKWFSEKSFDQNPSDVIE